MDRIFMMSEGKNNEIYDNYVGKGTIKIRKTQYTSSDIHDPNHVVYYPNIYKQTVEIRFKMLIFNGLNLVGVTGFEPATTWSQTRCATGLRYAPIALGTGKGTTCFSNIQIILI